MNDYEKQTENNRLMAISAEKNRGQHNGSANDMAVHGKGSNCICCKDSQSVYWFDNSDNGFCMMCHQSFISVPKPEQKQQKPFRPKQSDTWNWKKGN